MAFIKSDIKLNVVEIRLLCFLLALYAHQPQESQRLLTSLDRILQVHTNDDVEAYFHLATSSQKLFTFSAHRLVVVRRAAAMAQGMRPVAGSADSLVSSDEVMWKSADKDLPAGSVSLKLLVGWVDLLVHVFLQSLFVRFFACTLCCQMYTLI